MNNKFNKQFVTYKNGQIIEKKLCPDCNKNWICQDSTFCKSCVEIGDRNHFYKKTHSDSVKLEMKQKKIGYVPWNKGKAKKYFCNKCSNEVPGTKYCEECYIISITGENNPSKRKDVREKISKSNSGEHNGSWNGGISFFPYSKDFTGTLKESIRQRDYYTCQLCGKPENEIKKKLCIHHIDYNKENCNSDNLVSLCNSCNSKVNFNREEWKRMFLFLNVERDLLSLIYTEKSYETGIRSEII